MTCPRQVSPPAGPRAGLTNSRLRRVDGVPDTRSPSHHDSARGSPSRGLGRLGSGEFRPPSGPDAQISARVSQTTGQRPWTVWYGPLGSNLAISRRPERVAKPVGARNLAPAVCECQAGFRQAPPGSDLGVSRRAQRRSQSDRRSTAAPRHQSARRERQGEKPTGTGFPAYPAHGGIGASRPGEARRRPARGRAGRRGPARRGAARATRAARAPQRRPGRPPGLRRTRSPGRRRGRRPGRHRQGGCAGPRTPGPPQAQPGRISATGSAQRRALGFKPGIGPGPVGLSPHRPPAISLPRRSGAHRSLRPEAEPGVNCHDSTPAPHGGSRRHQRPEHRGRRPGAPARRNAVSRPARTASPTTRHPQPL